MDKCVILTRVASVPQNIKNVEDYAPVKLQLAKCRKYAKEHNFEIAKEVNCVGETDALELHNTMINLNAPDLIMVDTNKLARNKKHKLWKLILFTMDLRIHTTSGRPLLG